MHILIAEDDAPVARFLSGGLEGENYNVRIASTGLQVPQMVEDGPCDLVILDLNLPDVSGMEILRQVRGRKPHLPVLILTGSARVEDRVDGLDSGADDYLTKPFAFSELSARVRALLRRSSLPFEPVLRSRDLELDRVKRARQSQRPLDRTYAEGVRAPGISDAEFRTQCVALLDHPSCLETFLRHSDQCRRCLYQLFTKKDRRGCGGKTHPHRAWSRISIWDKIDACPSWSPRKLKVACSTAQQSPIDNLRLMLGAQPAFRPLALQQRRLPCSPYYLCCLSHRPGLELSCPGTGRSEKSAGWTDPGEHRTCEAADRRNLSPA